MKSEYFFPLFGLDFTIIIKRKKITINNLLMVFMSCQYPQYIRTEVKTEKILQKQNEFWLLKMK